MTASQFIASEKKLSELTRPELRDILQHDKTPQWLYQALSDELLKRIQDSDTPSIFEWWETVRDNPLFPHDAYSFDYADLDVKQQVAACRLYQSINH